MIGIRHRVRLLVLSLALIAGALIAGFILDWEGFTGNVLAELVGMLASILIAVLLVERFTKAERDARWAVVASATTRTLQAAAVRAALPVFVQLPAPRSPALDPHMALSMGRLSEALVELAEAVRDLGENRLGQVADARQLLDALSPSTRICTEVVLPRLLALEVGPSLIEPIVQLESAVAQLDYHAWMGDVMQLPAAAVYEDVARILDALARTVDAHDA